MNEVNIIGRLQLDSPYLICETDRIKFIAVEEDFIFGLDVYTRPYGKYTLLSNMENLDTEIEIYAEGANFKPMKLKIELLKKIEFKNF